ncbi:hypothetical protein [Collinsella tanakaei]|uniref:hypothetical protein n=1 Tax=Collinsella tanakaei TaxID=626935 RepID=UPI0026EA555A|nr:hypothetical protein [Collinsella tanakaei]
MLYVVPAARDPHTPRFILVTTGCAGALDHRDSIRLDERRQFIWVVNIFGRYLKADIGHIARAQTLHIDILSLLRHAGALLWRVTPNRMAIRS